MLSWIFKLNNYIFKFYGFLYRPPPGNETISVSFRYIIPFILGGSIMDEYLKQYREMISLRGLTDHTIISYSTYIRAYLKYLSEILHKLPEDVSWAELRDFIRWLQKEKQLSDRTVNHCISQLRFFTMYVLHRPWDSTQPPCAGLILIFLMSLPRKKSGILSSLFQTLNIRLSFPSCTPPASGSGKSVPCVTKISAVLPCVYISAIPKRVLTGMPSFHKKLWIS